MSVHQGLWPLLGVIGIFGTGCASTMGQLQQVSSGRVGCAPDTVAISDVHRGMNSAAWTASCHGKAYYCSGTDMLRGVSCAPKS